MRRLRQRILDTLGAVYAPDELNALMRELCRNLPGVSDNDFYLMPELPADAARDSVLDGWLRRLAAGEPLQYVLGYTDFFGLRLRCDQRALIPRPETTELVEWVVEAVGCWPLAVGGGEAVGNGGKTVGNAVGDGKDAGGGDVAGDGEAVGGEERTLLDVGTGSGCIALTLASRLPGWRVSGWDVSAEALSLARENAALNNVRAEFSLKDILLADSSVDPEASELTEASKASGNPETAGNSETAGNPKTEGGYETVGNYEMSDNSEMAGASKIPSGRFDVIVSNPPYITLSESAAMERNVLDYEPHLALFVPDDDPLRFYRAIARFGRRHLKEGGFIFFEINPLFAGQLGQMLETLGYKVCFRNDISGRRRMVKAST